MIRSTGPIRRGPPVVSPLTTILSFSALSARTANPVLQGHAPTLDKLFHIRAEFAARRQLVGIAAAENAREIGAARRPYDRRARLGLRELGEFEQCVAGRVAGSYDERCHARIDIPIAAENIGNAVGDPVDEIPPRRRRADRSPRADSALTRFRTRR